MTLFGIEFPPGAVVGLVLVGSLVSTVAIAIIATLVGQAKHRRDVRAFEGMSAHGARGLGYRSTQGERPADLEPDPAQEAFYAAWIEPTEEIIAEIDAVVAKRDEAAGGVWKQLGNSSWERTRA